MQQRVPQQEALAIVIARGDVPWSEVMGGPDALSTHPGSVSSPVEVVDRRMPPGLLISASPCPAFLPLPCAL